MTKQRPVDAENRFGRLEHLAPSWMKEKSLEITDRHSPLVDKFFHDLTKIFAHQSGEFWAQHDAKAIAFDVPSHYMSRVSPSVLTEREYQRPIATCSRALSRRPQNDASSAISEQSRSDEHRHARVIRTCTKAAKIDGDEEHVPSRATLSKARRACEACDAAAATEFEYRQPLDIRRKIQPIYQKRIETRNSETGDRIRNEGVDLME